MFVTRLRMRRLYLLLSLVIFIGVACGGQQAAAPNPTSSPDQATAPAADAPVGGRLIRLGDDPPTLDPHLTGDVSSAVIIVEVFGGLVTIEAQNPRDLRDPQLKIVGDMAEDWAISPDGTTYTFRLRENGKFQDGRLVTAEDFKWSLERAADPATQSSIVDVFLGDIVGVPEKLAGERNDVPGVRVIDQRTLAITADAPKAYFLAKLTYPTAFVLDKNNVEIGSSWMFEPNGTGPFRLAEYLPGEILRLERNEHYQLGPPKLDEVKFVLSGGDPLLMYENDEIHVTGVGLLNLEAIRDPGNPLQSELHRAPPSFGISYVGMNVNEAPFDDTKVRQALNYAVDKQTISESLLQNLTAPANSILPPSFPGYNPGLKGYQYDPEKAKQLLKESKYGENLDDFPRVVVTLPGSFGAPVSPSMEAILQMWRENLGIEVEILQTEWAIYLQDLHQRRFQMFGGLAWIADYPDPENFLDVLFHSESSNNHTGYANQEVDRLLESARLELNETKRFNIYHQVEEMILNDAPWVPLWHGNEGYVLVKPYVQDYFLFPLVIPRLRYVYMTQP